MEENVKKKEEEDGIHMHCLTCYRADCTHFQNCPITSCTNNCGISFHSCKVNDHATVCRNQVRPCINQSNGCPFKLDSIAMMSHLECCPASVVHCGMNWNRYPLYSSVRQKSVSFCQGNPVSIVGDLDTELAISDQLHLKKEMSIRMKKGKRDVTDKRLDTRIDADRISLLESLLTNTKTSNREEDESSDNGKTYIQSEDVKSVEGDDEEEDNALLTYDEAVSAKSDLTTFVTNTNIREAYSDVPNSYIDSGGYICELITRKEKTTISKHVESDLTKEEAELRLRIYSQLNLSYEPLGLNIILEKLTRYCQQYCKQYPMYNFSCSKVFRRDQYSWHCLNIHSEIQDNLNGNLFERCPMAQYGCPFSQFLLKPKYGKVRFYRPFASFTTTLDDLDISKYESHKSCEFFSLLDFHYDILLYILTFLDNMSINCIAKTCHAMKNLCCDILDKRGVVVPVWCKKLYSNGGSSWKINEKVRLFTTSCSTIREWTHTDVPSMGNHLMNCQFYKRPQMQDRVKLPIVESNVDVGSLLTSSSHVDETEYNLFP